MHKIFHILVLFAFIMNFWTSCMIIIQNIYWSVLWRKWTFTRILIILSVQLDNLYIHNYFQIFQNVHFLCLCNFFQQRLHGFTHLFHSTTNLFFKMFIEKHMQITKWLKTQKYLPEWQEKANGQNIPNILIAMCLPQGNLQKKKGKA